MYAYIRRYRIGSGTVDDLVHRVATEFAAQLAGGHAPSRVVLPRGIVDYRAVDTGGGTVATITTFDTEQHYREGERGAENIRLSLAEFDVEVIDSYGGPVAIAEAAP